MLLKIHYEGRDEIMTLKITDEGELYFRAIDILRMLKLSRSTLHRYLGKETFRRMSEICSKDKPNAILLTLDQVKRFFKALPNHKRSRRFENWFHDVCTGNQNLVAIIEDGYVVMKSTDSRDPSTTTTLPAIVETHRENNGSTSSSEMSSPTQSSNKTFPQLPKIKYFRSLITGETVIPVRNPIPLITNLGVVGGTIPIKLFHKDSSSDADTEEKPKTVKEEKTLEEKKYPSILSAETRGVVESKKVMEEDS